MNKGLKPEMVVTLANFKDALAFDQKAQQEINKTALYLKEYPSGNMVYKPALLNVGKSEFLSKELANNSLYIDDCDITKPFVMYAKPDKRHGFVVAFKKYYPPITVSDKDALLLFDKCNTLEDVQTTWLALSNDERKLPSVMAKKELLKTKFTK